MNLKSLLEQAEAYENSLPDFPGGFEAKGEALAAYFDSTILKTEATLDQVKMLCDDARQYHFAAICVNPI